MKLSHLYRQLQWDKPTIHSGKFTGRNFHPLYTEAYGLQICLPDDCPAGVWNFYLDGKA